ncbi:MAG: hypothetical protein SPF77_10570 [Gemmiger sp.]|uniref:hypothetical protein n=1 Tax=Gemmiger sp. TaxID=2049027 RepID=UPI002A914177|nr:hypothetical protein [Gemmiger sp.]MDY5503000.1 hypothetical protein [Gemmiger sp.]
MSEMNDIIKNGQLMPADLTAQIRDKYYHVDVDPFTKSKRLFFDNSGGSFRLKDASEAFRNVDDLPNCGGHGGAASDYLDSLRVQACKDTATSACWRSAARWQPRPSCCCSTSPPPV